MIDKEKIKKWVKQDAIVKDACSRVCRGRYGIATYKVEVAIDQAIDLAIEKTLDELKEALKP